MKVALFQRFFAAYQGGLVKALRRSAENTYIFFGDENDAMGTGIEPHSFAGDGDFRKTRTRHFTAAVAWQGGAITAALGSDFDVIILEGNCWMPSNWIAIGCARLTGKKVILYTHGWLQPETGCRKMIRNLFYHRADVLALYGDRAKRIGLETGFVDERMVVVHNSLDYDRIAERRDRVTREECAALRTRLFGADGPQPLLVCIGRLTRAKQLDLLIPAAAVLAARGLRVNLLLIGSGPEEAALREKAASAGMRVHFAGAISDETGIARYLAAAELAVIPGAAGLTVIHCLAYGLPVVTHDRTDLQPPEAEAVIAGRTGCLFQHGNEVSLADAIESALRQLPKSEKTRDDCIRLVEQSYHPARMADAFDAAVRAAGIGIKPGPNASNT